MDAIEWATELERLADCKGFPELDRQEVLEIATHLRTLTAERTGMLSCLQCGNPATAGYCQECDDNELQLSDKIGQLTAKCAALAAQNAVLREALEATVEYVPGNHQSAALVTKVLASLPPPDAPSRRQQHDEWERDYGVLNQARAALADPAPRAADLLALVEAAREVVTVADQERFSSEDRYNAPGHAHLTPPYWNTGDVCERCRVWQGMIYALARFDGRGSR